MSSIFKGDVSRRSVLAGAGALGAASLAFPHMAVSADGTVLTIRSYSDLQVLDPAFWLALPEADIMRSIYAPLVSNQQGDDWNWRPVAVESIEQLDDLTIAFKLRDNIGFTDGFGQMTADDVKFSIERIADPANESPYAGDWSALKEVEVKDNLSGLIHLKNKFVPLWTTTLPTPASCIVSRKAVGEIGGKIGSEPVAQSGQYILTEWVPKQKTVLKRNPDWAYEPGGYEEIHILPIEDPSTAELGFEAGDLDYTWTSVSSLPRLKENPPAGSVVEEKPSLAYVWLGMNQDNEALKDVRIRRAIQHAIDRQTVVDAAYFGAAAVGNGIIAPGLPGSRDSVTYDYDPNKARELLAEAGAEGMTVTLDILNQSERLTAAQVIQANLADVGITCEIKQNDSGTFWTLGSKDGDYFMNLQLVLSRFSMNPDPSWATVWFTPEQVGVWNWERFNNEEYKALHEEGLVESDAAKRDEIYKKMQGLMDESGCYVFLTHEVVGLIHKDTVDPGLKPNGEPLLPLFKPA
ncbi:MULTISPECIES: ABC transporter substrate-binding protein [unclassified Ruegeria]|uniref:ABC transporter substrate-binding protein n=1 Tax=unclassified Ruegeria TaxID=2625375 RepID=UPI001488C7E3|nr:MULTISPECIES: ABC transporter substrate-binding protein [unclassified Ruegeria]NOD35792.1 peptide ABC transporter substrate-binding protein [Ruegeria sp. HKCCD7296]NOE34357.1 peptide ABC transporter substrate-binding protein [Ruegeria sp. HKCCD7318]NOE40161.1 peptide ABC transporter substrate-binding protein [Ruegeria sp. HKCCD7319]